MAKKGGSPDDTNEPTVRKQLRNCQHIADPESAYHDTLNSLMSDIDANPTISSYDLLKSIGMSDEEASDRLAADSDLDTEAE